ncbi:glycosyltransferase [Roseateles sp. PN1]|uniref:glycosyltransferase n=1 Tax=Roseateles sp. PN1 TaxID=3137372 RepID=UPI0031395FBC
MTYKLPTCAVLLASYNGEHWLPEQLFSLNAQRGVDLRVIVSDDQSSDGTTRVLLEHASTLPLSILPAQAERFGSANRNFLRLVRDADIGNAEFVALADQDDIWHSDKLSRAIERLREDGAAAYSSDVEAFWPDGRKRIIKKSHAQKQFDHLFGSPGPGCTFVFTRALFLEIREWVTANFSTLSSLWVHDWILYAYARAHGHRWIIDGVPTMRYRQHQSNEIGVNFGLKAIQRRLAVVKEGRYRHDIVIIAELTGANPVCARALRRLSWLDRLWLIGHASQFRRSLPEVLALRLIFVLMPAAPIPEVA